MSFHLLTKTYNGQSYFYSEIRVACRLGLYAIFAHAVTYNHMRCRRWMGVFSRDGKWSVVKGASGLIAYTLCEALTLTVHYVFKRLDCISLDLPPALLWKVLKNLIYEKNDEIYIFKSHVWSTAMSELWHLSSRRWWLMVLALRTQVIYCVVNEVLFNHITV